MAATKGPAEGKQNIYKYQQKQVVFSVELHLGLFLYSLTNDPCPLPLIPYTYPHRWKKLCNAATMLQERILIWQKVFENWNFF